jgi:hypothetical protein
MVVCCASRKRYFDLDAVRVPAQDYSPRNGSRARAGIPGRGDQVTNAADEDGHRIMSNPAGAPPLDWWEIPTAPYPGSHFATWPPNLCVRPIEAMCPRRVCTVCGAPSERITKAAEGYADNLGTSWADKDAGRGKANGRERNHHAGQPLGVPHIKSAQYETTGWTDCGHGAWRPGVVLDPFAGSATTLQVAHGHGRSAIGIDLDRRNVELARGRLGMFLTVEDPTGAVA